MASRATRACDGCRVRKVKCNSTKPCSQCSHLGLVCEFSPRPTKRRPAIRNRLVAQLRDRSSIQSRSASGRTYSTTVPAVTSIAGIINVDDESPPAALSPAPSTPVWSSEFFIDLLPKYEEQIYPVNPVLSSHDIRQAIDNMHLDSDNAALVYAFAAVTLNLTTPIPWILHRETASQMTELIQRSFKAYRTAESVTDPRGRFGDTSLSLKRIVTCVFLEITMMTFKRLDRSFSILREAIGMVQMLHTLQSSSNAMALEPRDCFRFQRLYWELFVHERLIATLTGFPCIMTPLPTGLPEKDPSIPAHVDVGFSRLICLFQIIDGPFLSYWATQQQPSKPIPGVSPEWIESKQAQLDRDEFEAAEDARRLVESGRGMLTELQLADLFVTRLWLRTLLWKFELTHGFLRSAPPQDTQGGLSIQFPTRRLSIHLRALVSRLQSVSSVATLGSGILHKVFDITSTMADILALPVGYGHEPEDVRKRAEDFAQVARFLFSFERVDCDQRNHLREKLVVLQQHYSVVDFTDLLEDNPRVYTHPG